MNNREAGMLSSQVKQTQEKTVNRLLYLISSFSTLRTKKSEASKRTSVNSPLMAKLTGVPSISIALIQNKLSCTSHLGARRVETNVKNQADMLKCLSNSKKEEDSEQSSLNDYWRSAKNQLPGNSEESSLCRTLLLVMRNQ